MMQIRNPSGRRRLLALPVFLFLFFFSFSARSEEAGSGFSLSVPKEVKGGEKPGFEPCFAPIGDGPIDMKAAVEHAKAAGAEYFLVEQDNASKLPDSMGQVERSIRYITKYL